MKLEIEQKYPAPERAAVEARLAALGVSLAPAIVEIDQYFAHPARDFAQTDEALRIRRAGERCILAYKGPKLGAVGKARREIEVPVDPTDEKALTELLAALGFQAVAQVQKDRQSGHFSWQGRSMTVALDSVTGLGSFVELETFADEAEVDAAQQSLSALAAELGLSGSERRSYLELLLAGRS
jgi:adenylate cyclase class 2